MWRKGAHFGPHNLHENRPGSFISSTLILPLIRTPACVPMIFPIPIVRWKPGRWCLPHRLKMMDTRPSRPQVIQSCDVFVDAQGVIYSTDYNGGLSVIEYLG